MWHRKCYHTSSLLSSVRSQAALHRFNHSVKWNTHTRLLQFQSLEIIPSPNCTQDTNTCLSPQVLHVMNNESLRGRRTEKKTKALQEQHTNTPERTWTQKKDCLKCCVLTLPKFYCITQQKTLIGKLFYVIHLCVGLTTIEERFQFNTSKHATVAVW